MGNSAIKNKFNNIKLKIKIILIFAGIFLAGNANATALKITPSSINFDIVLGKTGQKVITIENPGKDVALFEVYPDDFSDLISVNPSSFTLNPEEKKEVAVFANFKNEGIFASAISIVSKPLSNRNLQTSAGVKVPLEIKVIASSKNPFLASISQGFKMIFLNNNFIFLLIFFGMLAAIFSFLIKKSFKKSL